MLERIPRRRVFPESFTSFDRQMELAKSCLEMQGFWDILLGKTKESELTCLLRQKRWKERNEFYSATWDDAHQVQMMLRQLAKDMEVAKQFAPSETRDIYSYSYVHREDYRRKQRLYLDAVEAGLVDSLGDIQRKADFLLGKLMQLDLAAFAVAMSQDGLQALIGKAELAGRLDAVLSKLKGFTIESAAKQLSSLSDLKRQLTDAYPEAAGEIARMIESERQRLEDEL